MLRTSSVIVSLVATLAACSDSPAPIDPTPAGGAQVQVLNALSPATPASLALDGVPVPMPASGAASRRAVEPGTHRLEVRGAGNALLGSSTFTVAAGSRRSLVLGAGVGLGVTILGTTSDSAITPLRDAAKVRVVHTVEGLPSSDAYLAPITATVDSAGLFVTPFEFGAGSDDRFPGYGIRPPGTYRVRAVTRATPAVVLAEREVTLAGGEVVDLVLVRLENGGIGWRVVRGS